jgi:hypothetical protein
MKALDGVHIVGIPWYRAEEYDACVAIMSDRAKLHTSYHLWRMDAETREKQTIRLGKTVVRVFIDPKEFPGWCRERGLNIDANARGQFAAFVAKEIATGGQQSTGKH